MPIYPNSNSKVASKNTDFDCWYIRTHTKEKSSKISNTEVTILLSSHENTFTKLRSWLKSTLYHKPPYALQNSTI